MVINANMETDIVQFYCDLCELSLELEPDTNEMRHLDALCEGFLLIMADMGIEFPPPKPLDDKIPF